MEPLSDPYNNRPVKSVKPPPHKPLAKHLMFPKGIRGKPNWKLIRDHLKQEGRVEKEDFLTLIAQTNKIFQQESNLLHIQDPLTVVGDIHGQFYDLLKILEVGGNPEQQKYLFLGDFVDRGSFSIEVLILLYSIKLCYPETVYFLRGNHECRQMTSFFNFRDECKYKYDQEIYDTVMESFDLMPIACIVNGKFLALHGGISPEMRSLQDIENIDRKKEPPKQGLMCDILWADPVDNEDGICENLYRQNEVRGCSYFYGIDAVQKFLKNTSLISIIRAHEAQLEGYKMHKWNGQSDFPSVITIFSAPNYCDVYNNKGAVIKFENNTLNIQQFNYTAHPYILPNFMDIFTWSIPFVAEKITEMLYHILKPSAEDSDDENDLSKDDLSTLKKWEQTQQNQSKLPDKDKQDVLRSKIKFIGRMMKFQKVLREESESIMQLKGQCPDKKIPVGLLTQGRESISNQIDNFKMARKIDLKNEKRPEFGPQMKDKAQPMKPIK
ncbi:hypothetical protein PPERSA_08882 [Pseudocohnilembus persalinus]|uniref:Serine/threonine-protein phosphatase n=1 Tax=Pseudocohnilembus persalinus TaxID=266149 RepID=A0A0V0QDW0_PSEPJ|nr:hypothetical protein PPERSA_08882 [Pseudocohnilembus persalinus]|eukprot:KRX00376.1 hypothetical protein PPERSA_08882 [Pseudocohnilembus persalinus]